MDKEQIANLAHKMESKRDLLRLLNIINLDAMEKFGNGYEFHPFTMRQINSFCNPNNEYQRYRQFMIKKKSGGERLITAPMSSGFMSILRCLNEMFKAMYTPSQHAMGFTEGRSVVSNADVHRGQNYILNIDLKDFFPSIEQPRVWKRLQLAPFNFPQPVANIIAGLCSMKETRELEDDTEKDFYVLPQGAPTSPIITNMICDKLDRRLAGLSKRFGLHYTRYADDITFSSMHNVYNAEGEFWTELRRIITDQGFRINEEKTRLQKIGARQEVTGIIVSDKLNVTQKYVRDIRNILYIWDRYGYSVAYSKFFPKYKSEKGHVKKGIPDLINVLDGKLNYLMMVKGAEDSVYKRLHEKFARLASKALDPSKTTMYQTTYFETVPILEFERKNNTEIFFGEAPREFYRMLDAEGPSVTKVPPHRYAYFVRDGKKFLASVNKAVDQELEEHKELLSISLCRDAKGKTFWLIHKSDKVTVPRAPKVDIDELNNELDSLLNNEIVPQFDDIDDDEPPIDWDQLEERLHPD